MLRPTLYGDTRGKGLGSMDLHNKEVLEVKTYKPSKANEPCHRTSERIPSLKMKTS
jgi:hypothetical protein